MKIMSLFASAWAKQGNNFTRRITEGEDPWLVGLDVFCVGYPIYPGFGGVGVGYAMFHDGECFALGTRGAIKKILALSHLFVLFLLVIGVLYVQGRLTVPMSPRLSTVTRAGEEEVVEDIGRLCS